MVYFLTEALEPAANISSGRPRGGADPAHHGYFGPEKGKVNEKKHHAHK